MLTLNRKIFRTGLGHTFGDQCYVQCTDRACLDSAERDHAHPFTPEAAEIWRAEEYKRSLRLRYGQADVRPGFYYVTALDDARHALLRGPFTWHYQAIAAADRARMEAEDHDPRAYGYSFGTCRSDVDLGPGILDKLDAERAR